MTSDGTHSYTWDARNHLKQIDSGATASFVYDSFGRRTSKSILGTQTGFLYDGLNPVQELSGTNVTANSLMGGVDEVFQRTDSAGARSFLTDALGSSIALADSTGTLQTQYTFDPFGNTTTSGGATTNSFAYTGRELDATELYFYRARYYNPLVQRFISEDPSDILGGINLYAYAGDNPIRFRDPLGLNPSPGRSGNPWRWVWVPEGNGEPGHYVLVRPSEPPPTDAQRIKQLAPLIVQGAGGIGDPETIGLFYVTSATAGGCAAIGQVCVAIITTGSIIVESLNPNPEIGPPNEHVDPGEPGEGGSYNEPPPISGPPTSGPPLY